MYVRTKDWIYDTDNLHYRFIENNKVYEVGWDVEKPTFVADIIKQSENLEELCDGFYNEIEDYEFSSAKIFSTFDKAKAQCDLYKSVGKNVRLVGFIKTDNCLKFVAKMNDEGDLELL